MYRPAFAECLRKTTFHPAIAGRLDVRLAAAKVPLRIQLQKRSLLSLYPHLHQAELRTEYQAAAERPAWRIGLPFEGCFGRAIRGMPVALRLS